MIVVFGVCLALLGGCATESSNYTDQRTFTDPDGAVKTLLAAAKSKNTAEIEAIFGSQGREVLSTGDPVDDRHQREVFVVAMDQGWSLNRKDSKSKELVIGNEHWPFPIPLVKDSRGWWFDTIAGKQEVLARRVGRNELAAIGVLRTYVIAQKEYASEGRDGKPAGIYAQKLRSESTKHDGLYWATSSASEKASPLGQFAADAAAEGHGPQSRKESSPYHGYYFRILTQQGKDAPGGASNYIVNGAMNKGFAMLAYPAEYGSSGIMSFQVSQDGVVYQADLGENTKSVAGEINQYNPGVNWRIAQ